MSDEEYDSFDESERKDEEEYEDPFFCLFRKGIPKFGIPPFPIVEYLSGVDFKDE